MKLLRFVPGVTTPVGGTITKLIVRVEAAAVVLADEPVPVVDPVPVVVPVPVVEVVLLDEVAVPLMVIVPEQS